MLEHGGRLIEAAEKFEIPLVEWIDLSTGINPHGWPVPTVPAECFCRLPEDNDALLTSAKNYYGVDSLLAVAGSQAAIQLLPQLRNKCRVAVPDIGYAEHAYSWQQAGHRVDKISSQTISQKLDQYDVVVLINPNNPSAEYFSIEQLLSWHQRLQKKGGWLIVDEAFMDASSDNSLLPYANHRGLIILRSIGKFFGLAGIRCGFVIAEKLILQQLRESLGPWSLSGPTRYVASRALSDTLWQHKARKELHIRSKRLQQLLNQYINTGPQVKPFPIRGTELFQTLFIENANHWHIKLSEKGVLTRLLDNKQGLRFGLPKDDQWEKLESILMQVFSNNNFKQHLPA